MSLLSNELHTAFKIALQAAELVRQYTGNEIKVEFKDGDEPVTKPTSVPAN
jgi:hypothetical protein